MKGERVVLGTQATYSERTYLRHRFFLADPEKSYQQPTLTSRVEPTVGYTYPYPRGGIVVYEDSATGLFVSNIPQFEGWIREVERKTQ